MITKRFRLGMLVMLLAFGMTVIGCDNGLTKRGNDGSLDNYWWGDRNSAIYVIYIDEDYISVEGNDYSSSNTFTGTISYKVPNFTVKTEEGRTFSGIYILDADTLEIITSDTRYLFLNGVYYFRY
jgi:hypothetical protein